MAHPLTGSKDLTPYHLLNRRQLQEILPISPMTIWRWEQAGHLPKHVTINGRSQWRRSEILDFVREQIAGGEQ